MRVNQEKKEDRERVTLALLRATLRLAATHGFVSLGLREVSRAADIAPTSFYRHFADMEELGRELIESLAGPFLERWISRAHADVPPGGRVVEAIASQALAGVLEDPELMRFIVAERVGAIPAFRAALARRLSAVSAAVQNALDTLEKKSSSVAAAPSFVADGIVALILDACGRTLDEGPEHAPVIRERLLGQLRTMLEGTKVHGGTHGRHP